MAPHVSSVTIGQHHISSLGIPQYLEKMSAMKYGHQNDNIAAGSV